MFGRWKKRKEAEEPVCVHDWQLVDMRLHTIYEWEVSPEAFYTIACLSCGKQRTLDEYEFTRFKAIFNVKGGIRDDGNN